MAQPNTSFRLSDDARALLGRLAVLHGLSRRSVLELAIREKAKRELATVQPNGAPA